MEEFTNLRGIIFDVDGTLYHQKPVRLGMALRLLGYYGVHLNRWRELYAIYSFRKIREKDSTLAYDQQIRSAAKQAGTTGEIVSGAIQKWMFTVPLKLIAGHANAAALQCLHDQQDRGKKIIIYSDYPVEEKLKALGVQADAVFYPDCCAGSFSRLKPSREAMNYILEKTGMEASQLLLIGDRDEKDGASAELVNMAFLNVKELKEY